MTLHGTNCLKFQASVPVEDRTLLSEKIKENIRDGKIKKALGFHKVFVLYPVKNCLVYQAGKVISDTMNSAYRSAESVKKLPPAVPTMVKNYLLSNFPIGFQSIIDEAVVAYFSFNSGCPECEQTLPFLVRMGARITPEKQQFFNDRFTELVEKEMKGGTFISNRNAELLYKLGARAAPETQRSLDKCLYCAVVNQQIQYARRLVCVGARLNPKAQKALNNYFENSIRLAVQNRHSTSVTTKQLQDALVAHKSGAVPEASSITKAFILSLNYAVPELAMAFHDIGVDIGVDLSPEKFQKWLKKAIGNSLDKYGRITSYVSITHYIDPLHQIYEDEDRRHPECRLDKNATRMDHILTFHHLGANIEVPDIDGAENNAADELLKMAGTDYQNYRSLCIIDAMHRIGIIDVNRVPRTKACLNASLKGALSRDHPDFALRFHRMGAEIDPETSASINIKLVTSIEEGLAYQAYYYHKLGAELQDDTKNQLNQAYQCAVENNDPYNAYYFLKMGARPTKAMLPSDISPTLLQKSKKPTCNIQ